MNVVRFVLFCDFSSIVVVAVNPYICVVVLVAVEVNKRCLLCLVVYTYGTCDTCSGTIHSDLVWTLLCLYTLNRIPQVCSVFRICMRRSLNVHV